MCCLYYYDHGTIEDVERIVGKTISSTFQGDVHPTDQALIITGKGNALAAADMRWGFLGGVDRKQLMISTQRSTGPLLCTLRRMPDRNLLWKRNLSVRVFFAGDASFQQSISRLASRKMVQWTILSE